MTIPTTVASPTPVPTTSASEPTDEAAQIHPLARLIGTSPSGYRPADAFENSGADDDVQVAQAIWSDTAWVTPDHPWLVATATDDPGQMVGVGPVRISTPLGDAIVSVRPDMTVFTGPIHGGAVYIEAGGISLDEITRSAAAMSLTNGTITIPDDQLPADLTLLARTSGETPTWTRYVYVTIQSGSEADDPGRLSVEVGLPLNNYQATYETFSLTNADTHSVDLGGTVGFISSKLDGDRVLTMDRNGLHVVVTGRHIDDEQLVAYATSLHTATDDEWRQFEQDAGHSDDTAESAAMTHRATLNAHFGGQDEWHATIDVDGLTPGLVTVDIGDSSIDVDRSRPSINASTSQLTGQSTSQSPTVVVAAAPAGTAPATLRIMLGDITHDTFFAGNDTTAVAATTFTDTGAYIAQILTADGTVIASFDPLTDPLTR